MRSSVPVGVRPVEPVLSVRAAHPAVVLRSAQPGTAPGRWVRRAAVPVLAALLLVTVGAGPAWAAEYRYWSFWTGDGAGGWRFATQGPSLLRPGDGTSIGFRFTISGESGADGQQHAPRDAADFDEVCGDTPAEPDRKRLALVVDFGTPGEAPEGQSPPRPRTVCAQVPRDASAAEALAATTKSLRYDSAALLCAIDGYPRSGCGDPVSGDAAREGGSDPGGDTETAGNQDDGGQGGGPSLGLVAGLCAVVLLGGAALWRSRRRRD